MEKSYKLDPETHIPIGWDPDNLSPGQMEYLHTIADHTLQLREDARLMERADEIESDQALIDSEDDYCPEKRRELVTRLHGAIPDIGNFPSILTPKNLRRIWDHVEEIKAYSLEEEAA